MRRLALTCCLLAAWPAQHALAQTLFESVRPGMDEWLRGTFSGQADAADVGPGCVGFVPTQPQFRLELEGDRWLVLEVDSAGQDSTLLVRGPSGTVCADDSAPDDLDPQLLSFFRAGDYDVFVGTKTSGGGGDFRLRIAEATDAEYPLVDGQRTLYLHGVSGGPHDASEQQAGCLGAIDAQPNHILRLERPMRLVLSASASSDLTLVVESADGVRCNDDGPSTLDPVVNDRFPAGLVKVYVGSHNPLVRSYYTLVVQPDVSG